MFEIFVFFTFPFVVCFVLFYFSNKGEDARVQLARDRADLLERKLQDCEKEVEFHKHKLKLMQDKEKRGE